MANLMHRFANPARFNSLAAIMLPWLWAFGGIALAIGLYGGLFISPRDYLQGDYVRLMYVHVPGAILGMGAWTGLAIASAVQLVWRHPLAGIAARAMALPGAVFSAICLITGSIWGKPTWGTWWVWDGRLTSMLVLFFLYLGYMALASAEDERGSTGRVTAIYGIVGAINIPIIHQSVVWWNSLHQGQSITMSGSTIDSAILWPLGFCMVGFGLIFAAVVLLRMMTILARNKAEARLRRMAQG